LPSFFHGCSNLHTFIRSYIESFESDRTQNQPNVEEREREREKERASISSTFFEQLLHAQIPKVPKRQ